MKTTSDLKMTNYVSITTLNRRNQGFTGSGVWLDFLFFENIIYIFLRDSLLNVFIVFIVFLFFFLFFYAVFTTVKTNEGHSQRSNCRKTSQSCSVLLSLLKVHVIASECVWVSVCAHTSRCNMELLLATKEHFDCQFFLVLKKKKKRSPCSIVAHLLLSPSTSLPFHI